MPIAIFTPYVCVIQTYHLSTTRDSKKYYDFLTPYSIPHEIRQGAKCHDEQVAYKFIFFVNQGYRRMALHAMEKLYE